MKIFLTAVFTSFAMLGSLAAQGTPANGSLQSSTATPSTQSTHPHTNVRISPGSVIPVQLMKTIDARKLKPGDEISAEVTEDLKTGTGEIIVPKNTKIIGKVTEAQARNKQDKESQVGIAFDHAVMKDGASMMMPLSIQAVIAPSYLNPSSGPSNESAPEASGTPSGGMTPGGRSPGMQQPQASNPAAAAGEEPASASANPNAHHITQSTQGVLGIQNLALSTAANNSQGSVLTSDKKNVKLEDGTLMLLRVNK
jgi:hypothetical protein